METVEIKQRYRKARRQYRKKRKKNTRRILGILFIIMLIVTVGIAIASHMAASPYNDDKEFEEYADTRFDSNQAFDIKGKTEKVYEYGSPISYAADFQVTDNETVNSFRQQKTDEMKSAYIQQKQAEEQVRAEENKENKRYRPPQNALIVDSAVYASDNGIISLAMYSSDNFETDGEMQQLSSSVDTYNFSEKTGMAVVPEQVFKENYREKCSDYFKEYFRHTYNEDELKKGWESYLSSEDSNFNKFVLTEKNTVFFFDEGTVLKKDAGTVSAKIPNNALGETLRDTVLSRYIDPAKPMVALTYDDGPGGTSEDRIIACLKKYGGVATFFYSGARVSKNPDKVKIAKSIGCEIGNHTWSHPQLTKIPIEDAKSEISRTNEAIKNASGSYPTVFRPSYGDTNSEVNSVAALPVIMWSIDTLDWKTRDPQKTFDSVKNNSHLDGKIVLMHSIHDATADATDLIVPWLVQNGYQTVTVSELIKYKYGETPVNGKVYR